jgi:tight adherence protein B
VSPAPILLSLVSALLAALACWLLVVDDARLARTSRTRWRPGPALTGVWIAVAVVASGWANPLLVANGVVAACVAGVVGHLVARARSRAAAAARRARVVVACDSLVAELRSGQPTLRALERVAEEWTELMPVATAARMGADVPNALRSLARLPGARAFTELAAAWQVSSRSGAGLAGVLDRMSAAIREQEDIARETAAAVAPARATAHLLGVLPVVGLGLGTALGGDPLHVLFGTPVGTVLLALGVALALVGVLWVEHLITSAAG